MNESRSLLSENSRHAQPPWTRYGRRASRPGSRSGSVWMCRGGHKWAEDLERILMLGGVRVGTAVPGCMAINLDGDC